MKLAAIISSSVIAILLVGCQGDKESQQVVFRSDFVPLQVEMTDYIFADGGKKLFRITGSVQLIVPLASYEPKLNGKCFEYQNLPKPVVDPLSLNIGEQVLVLNDRGLFTSRKEDSSRINELRKEAAEEMEKIAGADIHVQEAMKNTAEALKAFYNKFGYSCSLDWK